MHVPWSRFGLPHQLVRPAFAHRGGTATNVPGTGHSLADRAIRVIHLLPAQFSRLDIGLILITALVSLALIVDAVRRPYSAIDLPIMNAVQEVHHEWFREIAWAFATVTGSTGAVAVWLLVLAAMAAARWWTPLIATFLVPAGGVVNVAIEHLLVARTRPHLPELIRGSTNWNEGSFPSGHVLGAVMLYGLLLVWSGRIASPLLRTALRIWCIVIVGVVGIGRIWQGAHWPTDVFAAYSLGILAVVLLLAFERALQAASSE